MSGAISFRRWFRFSLRTLLAIVVVLAIPLAWVAKERRQSQHEFQIARQLEAVGAKVDFIGRFESQPEAAGASIGKPVAWWRSLLSGVCGPRVRVVKFGNGLGVSPFSDAAPLADLSQLEQVDLSRTQVEDLTPLAKLKCVRSITLSMIPARDLSPLAGLNKLKRLSLSHTRVENVAPLAELTSLTELDLFHTDVSDVSPLAKLTNLTNLTKLNLRKTNVHKIESLKSLTKLITLDIKDSQVTRGQAEYVHKKLPNCEILHDPFVLFSIRLGPERDPAKK